MMVNMGSVAILAGLLPFVAGAAAAPKVVLAHFMVGLTIDATPAFWKTQCQLAADHHIDAFALNVGADPWQFDQVQAAYDAASGVTLPNGSPFKQVLSLDMSAIRNNASLVTAWVTRFAPHPNNLLVLGNRPLISTFAGENTTFGAASLSDGWQAALKAPLAALTPPVNPAFVPSWTALTANNIVSNNPVVDGIFPWQAWPTTNTNISNAADAPFQANAVANSKLYMAASPCFFTHYSSKDYLFRSDDNLYVSRWQQLIGLNPQPDIIELISWNDYGESHYVGPLNVGTAPPNTTWADGIDHQAWLNMSDYFIRWYKKGGDAPGIDIDQVYFNYRPHPESLQATADVLPPPTNANFSSDKVYAAVFLTRRTTVTQLQIVTGAGTYTFPVSPGVSTFSAPFVPGTVQVSMLDSKGAVLTGMSGSMPISSTIATYNFNYVSNVLSGNSTASSNSAARHVGPPGGASTLAAAVILIIASLYW